MNNSDTNQALQLSENAVSSSNLCSGCNKNQGTVNRNMFDGMCANCTTKALYDYDFAKKAQIRNEELKEHFA